jgi:hypothetical protein
MTSLGSKLRAALVLAPLSICASCASKAPETHGPPVPAPLTALQAASIAERHTGGGNSLLSIVSDLDDGWLFGVDSAFNGGHRPPSESRLLFVHDDGTVRQWPGR